MHSAGAIILAAGLSSRMGDANKLLLHIDGIPMIRCVVQQYCSALDGVITVVTGHQARDVCAALDGMNVTCVHNPDYAQGQQGSVAIGLKHAPDAEVLLIGLGDQPLLTAHDIKMLMKEQKDTAPSKVAIPAKGDQRGNPICVPHKLRALLMADPLRPGCMRFTRDNPDMVHRYPLVARGFYTDIDTPKDYAMWTSEKEFSK